MQTGVVTYLQLYHTAHLNPPSLRANRTSASLKSAAQTGLLGASQLKC